MIKKIFAVAILILFAGAGLIALTMYLGFKDIKRGSYPIKASPFSSWDEVLKNPGSITVENFQTGSLDVKKSGLLNLDHPAASNIKEEIITIPVFVQLISHKKFGNYLVDTGLDRGFLTNPYGSFSGLLVKPILSKGYIRENELISEIIKARKIDMKGVFLTHLHFDHFAGVADLPGSLQYICGKGEEYPNYRYLFFADSFRNVSELLEIDFTGYSEMEPFGPAVDIFGDGSLWAISAKGHTNGFIAFLVNGETGPVLLLGDACSTRIGFKNCIGPGTFSSDIPEAQRFVEKSVEFVKRYPKTKVVFGHDLSI